MRLTTELFEQVSTALRADGRAAREQRRSPRVGMRARVWVVPLAGGGGRDGDPVDAWVRDLSAVGIGLTLGRPLTKGASFAILLPAPDGTFVAVRYKVAHCGPLPAGQHTVGGRLDAAAAGVADAAVPTSAASPPAVTAW